MSRRTPIGSGSGGGWLIVVLAVAVLAVAVARGAMPGGLPGDGPGGAPPGAGAVVWPVGGSGGRVSSGFGTRWGGEHGGTDIAAPTGTPVRAVAAGRVIEAGPASGFGLWVRLRHDRAGDGAGSVSVYGHVHTITTRVGARVQAGQQIATVGSRGQSTGPHLHLEIWPAGERARRVDPARWLTARHADPPGTGR